MRTLFWRGLDAPERLSAGERAQLGGVALGERGDIAVGEVKRGLVAVEHEHDERGRDALVARGRELVGSPDGPVILLALKVHLLLGGPGLFDQRLVRLGLKRPSRKQLLRQVLNLLRVRPEWPVALLLLGRR